MYLRVIESAHPLRRIAEPESTDPFYCTALGRAIVGHLDDAQRGFLLKQPHDFASRTPQTVTGPAQLAQILDEVKRSGYAIERDQTDVGVTCIGAPVFDAADQVIAAISLSVPSARATNDGREPELIEMVCHAAERLSESIGSKQTVNAHAALSS
jgi:IclR family acetate operon transcriptional repressor/IclR family KDG regulon transcriptional repressor